MRLYGRTEKSRLESQDHDAPTGMYRRLLFTNVYGRQGRKGTEYLTVCMEVLVDFHIFAHARLKRQQVIRVPCPKRTDVSNDKLVRPSTVPDEKERMARMRKAVRRCDRDSESHRMMEKAVNHSNYLIS